MYQDCQFNFQQDYLHYCEAQADAYYLNHHHGGGFIPLKLNFTIEEKDGVIKLMYSMNARKLKRSDRRHLVDLFAAAAQAVVAQNQLLIARYRLLDNARMINRQ